MEGYSGELLSCLGAEEHNDGRAYEEDNEVEGKAAALGDAGVATALSVVSCAMVKVA
jgi:hypothetical protein